MSQPESQVKVRPLDDVGSWLTTYLSHVQYARMSLEDLHELAAGVRALWPGPLDQPVREGAGSAELWKLAKRRDRASLSVVLFSALAVEAFVNFYGTVRLGEVQFEAEFERNPKRRTVREKLPALLHITDGIALTKDSRLMTLALSIADRRNRLVHPKTKEARGDQQVDDSLGSLIPDVAERALSEMDQFFAEFAAVIPEAAHLLPTRVVSERVPAAR